MEEVDSLAAVAVMPLVSVVMPTYNRASYIDQAIQSCLDQTHKNWELIVVDDASTDDTSAKVAAYAAHDSRIRLVRHDSNRRLPAALNTGIRHMRGQYYTWLSDDDLFRPHAIETMVRFLEAHRDTSLVYSDYTEIDEGGREIQQRVVGQAEELGIHKPVGVSHLVRREVLDALGGYAEDLFLVEDLDFWIRALMRFKMAPLHADLFLYRRHGTSLTSSHPRALHTLHAEILRRHLPRMHWMDAGKSARAYLRLAKRALNHRDFANTCRYLVTAVRFSPGFVARKLVRKARTR